MRRDHVTIAYDTKVSVPVTLWGSLGDQPITIPRGSGSKTFSLAGATLVCASGAAGNWMEVMNVGVGLGDEYVGSRTYSAIGVVSFLPP